MFCLQRYYKNVKKRSTEYEISVSAPNVDRRRALLLFSMFFFSYLFGMKTTNVLLACAMLLLCCFACKRGEPLSPEEQRMLKIATLDSALADYGFRAMDACDFR